MIYANVFIFSVTKTISEKNNRSNYEPKFFHI